MNIMRKIIFSYLFLVSLTLGAQDFTASQNTLLALNVLPGSEILDKLDSYEPKTTREKDNFKESKAYLEAMLTELAINSIYTELAAQKEITLEDKDALRDYITYGKDGLPVVIIPKSAIKKLVKKGYETDYYFVVNLATGLNLLMKGLPGQIKPQVTCTIKVFDQDKKQVKKIEEKVKMKTAIKMKDFPKRKFDKLDKDYMTLLVEKLTPLVKEAFMAACKQL